MRLYYKLREEDQERLNESLRKYPLTTAELIDFLKSTEAIYDLTISKMVELSTRLGCRATIAGMYELFDN